MYCINRQNGMLDKTEEKKSSFRNDKTAQDTVKECLKEYSLEDKIEALKHMLAYNDKHAQERLLQKEPVFSAKKTIGVKECLQGDQESTFQTIITELRNTVMNSYWNKEVGKTRYQIPNLPMGMDLWETTFGKKTEWRPTMAELLQTKVMENTLDQNILDMYKKSHNSYQPAEQIKRDYKEPFDHNRYYGKSKHADVNGTRIKKLLKSINSDPTTIVNSILADFMERSHSRVGEMRNLKNIQLYMDMMHGKRRERKEKYNVANVLSDCVIHGDVALQQKYLQYINTLRHSFKKRVPDSLFVDISEKLFCLDKEYIGLLSEDKVYSILAEHKLYINKMLLTPLLDLLQIRKGKDVNYKELLNLLNWKYDFPELPKIEKLPEECQYYTTIYKETIGKVEKVDATSIQTAGIPYDTLGDTAYSLIFPSIFTQYGLSHTDLSKLRSKEEIKSIFESIGVQFPNNHFDLLWEKGIKENNTENLSVETFRTLFEQYNPKDK
ncbi:EF-hand domain-containing family member B [Calliopsis andreniformis]|uniref:EF-hand domain-containing family member B n=1 Tax=Calliopsis andreniformis TaxID=337506 RepID=UPI003FCEC1A5